MTMTAEQAETVCQVGNELQQYARRIEIALEGAARSVARLQAEGPAELGPVCSGLITGHASMAEGAKAMVEVGERIAGWETE